MHARLIHPDATTHAVSLPAGFRALEVICNLVGSGTVTIVHIARPGPRGPGVDLWSKDGIRESSLPGSPAAPAVAALLPGKDLHQNAGSLALFSSGPNRTGQRAALTSEYDQIITTIAAQVRPHAPSGTRSRLTGGTSGVEVR